MPTSVLAELLAPTRCLSCRRRAVPPWCAWCRAAAVPAATGCPRCADPWPGHDCPVVGTVVVRSVARWRWDGPVRDVVATAKSRGAWAGFGELARDLADLVRPHLRGAATVTGVPAHPSVVRRRGIDHGAVLADVVARGLDAPRADLLEVARRLGDQGRAGGRAGRADLAGAFVAPRTVPSQVVLVDDVMTTGATVRAAAEGLGAAGAKRVVVAVVARAGTVSVG